MGQTNIEAIRFLTKQIHQRKAARSKQVVATKALVTKICKACYFIIRDQVGFDVKKIFG